MSDLKELPAGARARPSAVSLGESIVAAGSSSRMAALLMSLLVLFVALSPRIRVSGASGNVDLRLQDFLLVVALVFLLLRTPTNHAKPLSTLWGAALPLFVYCATVGVLLTTVSMPEVSLVQRFGFFGRTLELFVLAGVIAGLYLRAGDRAGVWALRALHVGAMANIAWVMYQSQAGVKHTLLGSGVGNAVQAYGPKLIGEPSAFGTGQYFAFIAALGVAEMRAGQGKKIFGISLVVMGSVGAVLSQSRISIGAVVVLLVLSTFLSYKSGRTGVVAFVLIAVSGLALSILLLDPAGSSRGAWLGERFASSAVEAGVDVRVSEIWAPQVRELLASPILGVGPGGLAANHAWTEAHNVVLRAFLDFGLVVGTMFVFLLWVVLWKSYRATVRGSGPQEYVLFSNLALGSFVVVAVGGVFQDSMTAVTSSHLLMVSIGLFSAVHSKYGVAPRQQVSLRSPGLT